MPHARFTELKPEENEGITHEYRGDKWRLILGWDIHNDAEPFIQLWYGIEHPEIGMMDECAGTYNFPCGTEPVGYFMDHFCIPYANKILADIFNKSTDEAIRIVTDTYKLR